MSARGHRMRAFPGWFQVVGLLTTSKTPVIGFCLVNYPEVYIVLYRESSKLSQIIL